MKVLEKNQAQASLSEYVDQIDDEPIIVQIHGKPVAVLMSLEDVDWETISLSLNPQFLSIIQRSRLRDKTEGRVSSEAVRQMFETEQ
jgi:prevent-host-death family protein